MIPAIVVACFVVLIFTIKYFENQRHNGGRPQSSNHHKVATQNTGGQNHVEKGLSDKIKTFMTDTSFVSNHKNVGIAVALIHIGLYLILEKFYWSIMWRKEIIFLQIALAFGYTIMDRGKNAKSRDHIFGKLVIVATLLVFLKMILYLSGFNLEAKVDSWNSGSNKTLSGVSVATKTSPTIPMGPIEYPMDQTWPDKDKAEEILKGQWDLLAACYRESRLKQFNDDGSVATNTNENGTTDTGICQINSVHDPELTKLGLDKNKLEDNLQFAKILYDREGLKPWLLKKGEKIVFKFYVTSEWSSTFKFPQFNHENRRFVARFDPEEQIHIGLNSEKLVAILEPDPGFTNLDLARPIVDYKFRLLPGKTEKKLVTVTYQH